MTRIVSVVMIMALIAVMALFAVSCGDDNSGNNNDDDKAPCTTHVDSDNDGKCDNCGEPVENNGGNSNDDNGNNDTEKEMVDYTLTVKDQSGAPVSGLKVAIVIKGTTPDQYYTTDATGKVTVQIEKQLRRITAVFEDNIAYQFPTDKEGNFAIDSTEHTVTVTKLTAYTVRVIDASGAPVANSDVQLCYGETCLAKQKTDENGEYTVYINYTGAPKVIVFDVGNDYIYFDEGETTLVVTVPEA